MILEVFLATLAVATLSLTGVLLFGGAEKAGALERFVVPAAVGVFLALIFTELLPETFLHAPAWAGMVIAATIIGSYAIANLLHGRLHQHGVAHSDKREAAILILFGDALHNFGDGVLIATAWLLDPAAGVAATIAIALHELPLEIVEYGVLVRAGYSRRQALARNFLSASTVIVGGLFTIGFASLFEESLWIIAAVVAGNLLYVSIAELLPRLHSRNVSTQYGSFYGVLLAVVVGFAITAGTIMYAHEYVLPEAVHDHGHVDEYDDHGHDHDDEHSYDHDEDNDHHEEEQQDNEASGEEASTDASSGHLSE